MQIQINSGHDVRFGLSRSSCVNGKLLDASISSSKCAMPEPARVCSGPGESALTRICRGPSSTANERTVPFNAAFTRPNQRIMSDHLLKVFFEI